MSQGFARRLSLLALAALFAAPLAAAPPVIDDQEIARRFKSGLVARIGTSGIPSADDLSQLVKTAQRKPCEFPLTAVEAPVEAGYETLSRSVYVMATLYKCGKCERWHQGGSATAWCLSPDGLMATNAHVFRGARGAIMGVVDRQGNAHAVTQLLGFDTAADVAIFRVDGRNLAALPLGAPAGVGTPITVISHPGGNHYVNTTGHVARYARRPADNGRKDVTWMAITADYAKGSSGGPVLNGKGEVVGMVCSTVSLYTEPSEPEAASKSQLQMVMKHCVPVDAIRALFGKPDAAGPSAGR